MTRAHRFAALPLFLAGALMVLAAGPAAAQGRDAVSGVAAVTALPDHAGELRMAAKDDRRFDRGHDRRDHRADRRDNRRDHRADRRDNRHDHRADRRHDRRDYHDQRRAYREGFRDGRRYDDRKYRHYSGYRYKNRWGYRPGHYVPPSRYVVIRDYHHHGYHHPPRGHGYVRIDGDVFLVALATGLIVSALR